MKGDDMGMTTEESREVTSGWLFMTANALGLSNADLSHVVGVNPDTIRRAWKFGSDSIAPGVRSDLETFISFTDACVDFLISRAEMVDAPAIIVYPNIRDVPPGHLIAEYGVTWWDHIAFSVHKRVSNVFIGTIMEVADRYNYLPWNSGEVHKDPSVLAIFSSDI